MAKNVAEEASTNNLEGNRKTEYKVTFGNFDENEKGEMNFPPENAKTFKGLLKSLEVGEMTIEAKNHTKVLGKNGEVVARVAEDGRVLTGKPPKRKTAKQSDEQVKE